MNKYFPLSFLAYKYKNESPHIAWFLLPNKIMYKREKFPITKELIEFFIIGSEILIINNFSSGLPKMLKYFYMVCETGRNTLKCWKYIPIFFLT